jgi:hypothetical protein
MTDVSDTSGCLAGLRVLDLSRILAGVKTVIGIEDE